MARIQSPEIAITSAFGDLEAWLLGAPGMGLGTLHVKIARTCWYYMTMPGRHETAAGLRLKDLIPGP